MLKNVKRNLSLILSIVVCCSSFFVVSYADTKSQTVSLNKTSNDIVMVISTEKDAYQEDETIPVSVEIRNISNNNYKDFKLNVVYNMIGIECVGNSEFDIGEFCAGEVKFFDLEFKKTQASLTATFPRQIINFFKWSFRLFFGIYTEIIKHDLTIGGSEYTLKFCVCDNSEKEYVDYNLVKFDSMGGSSTESQRIPDGEKALTPITPTKNGNIFVGWFEEANLENLEEAFDFATPINTDVTLYAAWVSDKDTDGDQLIDYLETYYKTDVNNVDTDGDTLSDYIEVVITKTNPLSEYTDGNELSDADTDSDVDGLSNAAEISAGTNPGDSDTDADGLKDGEEKDYATDPLNFDTDSDGASDGVEVVLGYNPVISESDFEVHREVDTEDSVSPSVDINLKGEQLDTLSINALEDENLFPEDMPGYMGKAYDFSVEGEFDKATISFEFDPLLYNEDAEPTIFYFNEEKQELEELKTVISGGVASAEVEHFSTYILIDRKIYYESFEWVDTWENEGSYNSIEIILVIDDSGSMASNDRNNERLIVAKKLVDNLPKDSKVGVVWFESNVKLLTPELTADREAAKKYLTTEYFKSSGGTQMYSAINQAFNMYESDAEDVMKAMVVLSDGNSSGTDMHASTIQKAKQENIRIYTVGLGNSTSYFTRYLQPLSQETNGAFYLASNADELSAIYSDINNKIDLEAHSDKDGIPDYYEDHMFSFNGKKIYMDKTKEDTDGDKLPDNKEIEVQLIYNADKSKVYVKGKLKSYPHLPDSDNDGIDDYYDPKPMVYTITDRTLAMVEGLSYTDLAKYTGKTIRQAVETGATINGISDENIKLLYDAKIVYANNSGSDFIGDLVDEGLGSIALEFVRPGARTAVIYALRGTEPDDDLLDDAIADVQLGLFWDTVQSKVAFEEYKAIATNKSYDYYITGHSLGGRLALDVLFKIYNANEGGLFKSKSNIITPVHAATFNSLGYNNAVYLSLIAVNNDVISSYKDKLTNYYYWLDLVGEGLGCSDVYIRPGLNVKLDCKNKAGEKYRTKEYKNLINVRDSDYHGIEYFQNDYDMLYESYHGFKYWSN